MAQRNHCSTRAIKSRNRVIDRASPGRNAIWDQPARFAIARDV